MVTADDKNLENSGLVKKCQETDCAERIAAMSPEQLQWFNSFTYCPFCAEELILVCGKCQEAVSSGDFKFCPWCGAALEE